MEYKKIGETYYVRVDVGGSILLYSVSAGLPF